MISVIVPVYNVEAYLRKCLDSILSQTSRTDNPISFAIAYAGNQLYRLIKQRYYEKG
ncbi:MAG: glycosyltransferase [Clostridia bacterium]|nr:glycosyltransferase [Clostridia bacterium]